MGTFIKNIKSKLDAYQGELLYTSASLFRPMVALMGSLIATAFIPPAEMGMFQAVFLIIPYLAFLHFGVFNGLARNVAFYKAQGDMERVQRMVNASARVSKWVAFAGILAFIVMLLLGFYYEKSWLYLLTIGAVFSALFFGPMTLHIDTTFRSGQEFKQLGKIIYKESTLDIVNNTLPIFLGYYGKLIREFLRPIIAFFFRVREQPIPPKGGFQKADLQTLTQVGFPLLVGSYFFGVFNVADQSLILKDLGEEALGFYTISKLVLTTFFIIPATLVTMYYPKASAIYGRLKNNRELRPFFWKSLGGNILLIIPLCLVGYFLTEPVVRFFLPKYIPGIEAAKISFFTCMTYVYMGPSVIMAVVRRNIFYIIVILFSIAAMWLLPTLLPGAISLEKIAWLRCAIGACILTVTLLYCFYLSGQDTFEE